MNDDVRDVIAAGIRHRLNDAQRAHKVDIDFAMDVLGTLNRAGMRVTTDAPLPDDIAGLVERAQKAAREPCDGCCYGETLLALAAALERQGRENERLKEYVTGAEEDAEDYSNRLVLAERRLKELEDENVNLAAACQMEHRENERLHERLEDNHCFELRDGAMVRVEVEPGSIPDGIYARDTTIACQEDEIVKLKEAIDRLRS